MLVLTGYAEADELDDLQAGIEIVRKPVRADTLIARVSHTLSDVHAAQLS